MRELIIPLLFFPLVVNSQTADRIAPDHSTIRAITSYELSKELIPGWNVGNSLEAIGGETNWGNPKISQQLIDSVKAAGFKSVRVPVAWSVFSDAENFVIQKWWIDRVEEVVNYILKDSMYVILNIHWDGGWMQPTYEKKDYVNNRLAIMWKQISIRFRGYSDSLIFAGTNEVMVNGDYGTPTVEYYTVQNSYNQTFVNTVRATGGRNAYRFLAVQGFNTNIDYTNAYFQMPLDTLNKHKLFVEVHYYDPYNFTLNKTSSITQWGKYASKNGKFETWANESYADNQFKKMKTKFADNGYGVILGEYGAIARTNLGSDLLNAEHVAFRQYYTQYITRSIIRNQLVPIIWDNGFTNNHSFGMFNRATGEQAHPKIISAIVDTLSPLEVIENPNPASIWNGEKKQLMVFQNQGYNELVIDSPIQSSSGYIINHLGQQIEVLDINEGRNIYHLHNLKAGIYFLQIVDLSYRITQKILIN